MTVLQIEVLDNHRSPSARIGPGNHIGGHSRLVVPVTVTSTADDPRLSGRLQDRTETRQIEAAAGNSDRVPAVFSIIVSSRPRGHRIGTYGVFVSLHARFRIYSTPLCVQLFRIRGNRFGQNNYRPGGYAVVANVQGCDE